MKTEQNNQQQRKRIDAFVAVNEDQPIHKIKDNYKDYRRIYIRSHIKLKGHEREKGIFDDLSNCHHQLNK